MTEVEQQQEQELSDVERRRQSVMNAKRNFNNAKEETLEMANIYSKDAKLAGQGQAVQLSASKRWYEFQAPLGPKELTTTAGTHSWAETLEKNMKDAEAVLSSPLFAAPANKSGVAVEMTANTVPGVLARLSKDIAVSPRQLLLTYVRSDLRAQCTQNLLYCREHYKYGDQASLLHLVEGFGPSFVAVRDFGVVQSWTEGEDGTITLVSRSVDNLFPQKVIPGAVRGNSLIFTVQMKPKKIEKSSFFSGKSEIDGSAVTVVVHTVLKGMLPNMFAKKYAVDSVVGHLNSVEKVLSSLDESKIAYLVNKFVLHSEEEETPEN